MEEVRVLTLDIVEHAKQARKLGSLRLKAIHIGLGCQQLLPECVAVVSDFSVHLNQLEYPLPLCSELSVQFLKLIFVKPELLPAGLEWRRAAEPVVSVFDIGGIHGSALLCTVWIYSNRGD
ncbi:hypothetical protein [Pseudomonas sp. B7]|uniref:hypothetical protein n=1 Tax=Pseudomonas sp. B7 TaxID=360962 RepID=UPI00191FB800|nr:hypothetical protein [Pseudomonas sp. B7]MBL0793640.1 hypothetical protein [Pseudomonas sp. B7]